MTHVLPPVRDAIQREIAVALPPSRARAASSALVLLALVLGAPVVLLTVAGSPIPHRLPSWQQVGQRLLQPDDGTLLVQVLLAVAWLSWVAFTISFLAEVPPVLRGRRSARLPGLAHLQGIAAQLVTSAALLIPSVSASASAFAAPPAVTDPAAPTVDAATDVATGPVLTANSPPPATPPELAHPLYVVRGARDGHRDTLWSIAAEHLGSPLRWREIAALNLHRPQPDGARLTDPHWIRPGWRLLMPPDATGVEPTPASTTETPAPPVQRPPVQHPAVQHPAVQHPAVQHPAVPPQDSVAPSVPEAAGPSVVRTERAAAPASPRADRSHPPVESHRVEAQQEESWQVPAELAGLGVLAAGLLAGLAKLRRVQRRHRRPGERIVCAPRAAATESRLRVAADPDRLTLIACAIDALSPLVTAGTQPAVTAVEVTGDTVDLHLAEPADPPAPFTTGGAGSWRITADDLPEVGGGLSALLPTLVTVGHDHGRELLIDLERSAFLAVDGPDVLVRHMVYQMAIQLASAPWSTSVTVHLIGGQPELSAVHHERLQPHASLTDDLVHQMEQHLAAAAHLANGVAQSRLASAPEPWPTHVLLIADLHHAGSELLQRLSTLTTGSPATGVAVVAAGWPAASRTLRLHEDGSCELPWLNRRLQTTLVPPGAISDVALLFSAARDLDSAVPATAVDTQQPAGPPAADADDTTAPVVTATGGEREPVELSPAPAAALDEVQPQHAPRVAANDEAWTNKASLDEAVAAYLTADPVRVRVQLLGPVEIHASGPVTSNRVAACAETVALLASHPNGVTAEQYDAALWPDRRVRPETRHEVLTRTRKWLGDGPEGTPLLPYVEGRRIRLSDEALVDWRLFQALVDRARTRQEHERLADLRTAVSLIRGAPFEHVPATRYRWLAGENLEEDMAATLTDVANALAEACLELGDLDGARRAARQAQRVDRADERSWRTLLQLEAANGNPRSVRAAVSELLAATEVDSIDELLPETAALVMHLQATDAQSRRATG